MRNLLSQTSGIAYINFPWWVGDPIVQAYRVRILSNPGSRFSWEGGDFQIVMHLIGTLTSSNAQDFAKERLFTPLGISDIIWGADAMDYYDGCADLTMHPRGLLKIGQLYLLDGAWNGAQVLDAAWTREAMKAQVDVPIEMCQFGSCFIGMGYGWSTVDTGSLKGCAIYCCGGTSSDVPQMILLVLPDSSLVILLWNQGVPGKSQSFNNWIDFVERSAVTRFK